MRCARVTGMSLACIIAVTASLAALVAIRRRFRL
jgi:hypothetical protein